MTEHQGLGARSRAWLETGATVLLVIAAVVAVGFSISDRVSSARMKTGSMPSIVEGWEAENAKGIWMGPASAPIVVTEFMDFQCPFCARFVHRTDSLMEEFPGKVAVVMHHFPLLNNPHSIPAAIAAECAAQQNQFESMYRALFSDQRGLGTRPWGDYAVMAGVPNLDSFDECTKSPPDSFPRIQYGRELGVRVGVRGTPTVWVNGRAIGRSDLPGLRLWAKEVSKDDQ